MRMNPRRRRGNFTLNPTYRTKDQRLFERHFLAQRLDKSYRAIQQELEAVTGLRRSLQTIWRDRQWLIRQWWAQRGGRPWDR